MSANFQMYFSIASNIATVFALLVIIVELYKSFELSKTSFEDHIFSQFLELSYTVPYQTMVGTSDRVNTEEKEAIFNFIMLSNHCIRLYEQGRIRKHAWYEIQKMIHLNLSQKAFIDVWKECIENQPKRFESLAKIIEN